MMLRRYYVCLSFPHIFAPFIALTMTLIHVLQMASRAYGISVPHIYEFQENVSVPFALCLLGQNLGPRD